MRKLRRKTENERNMAFLCLTSLDFSNTARFSQQITSSAGGEKGDVQHFVEAFREQCINKQQEVVCLNPHRKFMSTAHLD